MYTEERRNKIIDLIEDKGKVTVNGLANQLGVSEVTIRSDLEYLQKKDLINRTYGGAIKKETIFKKYTLTDKEKLNIIEKTAIAKEAVVHIKPNMVIYLDSGTTTKIMLTMLDSIDNITIVTTDILIAYEISAISNIRVVLLGGVLDKEILSTNSGSTLNSLDNYHFDICFIGCDGFDANKAYTSSEIRALMKHKVINNSEIKFLLADSSKFNNKNQYVITHLDSMTQIITDNTNSMVNNSEIRNINTIKID